MRDGYSNFGFYNALASELYDAAGEGRTIDIRGYQTVTFVVNAYDIDSGTANSAADVWKLVLQHGLASAAGVSAWSNVPASQIIHSVYGGYESTAETGLWDYVFASTSLSTEVQAVGYKPDDVHRYVRLYLSISGNPSTGWFGATAICGEPGNWPVNSPVKA